VNYQIQGKTLLLLVDKFDEANEAEMADTAASAYLKAADLETVDQKKKFDYMVKAGDVYRASYNTDKAIEAYKKVLATDSNNISALYGIGLAAMGTAESDDTKRKDIYQTAADYLKVFVDKAGTDSRAAEAKGVLDTLAKDYKIKPRPIK